MTPTPGQEFSLEQRDLIIDSLQTWGVDETSMDISGFARPEKVPDSVSFLNLEFRINHGVRCYLMIKLEMTHASNFHPGDLAERLSDEDYVYELIFSESIGRRWTLVH